ncbi:MAG: pyridoxamine 5'-phosphate oxidase family protein [Actinobacteria bacterium]|nr:pyridoxamine 5'-phosphate oxidase family protein [Actinomycetota bacterium]
MAEKPREIRRKPHRSVDELQNIYEILDAGYVAHLGFNDPESGESTVIPLGYARDGERLLFHGSTGSRLFMALKAGVQVCATVTLLDGLVAARSAFNSSMNYRSVMVFGVTKALEDEEKSEAMKTLTNKLIPGLWEAGRPITPREFAQTMIVELPLDDVTAKERSGGALDHEDAGLDIWAGQIPIITSFRKPITNDDASHVLVPEYIENFGKWGR